MKPIVIERAAVIKALALPYSSRTHHRLAQVNISADPVKRGAVRVGLHPDHVVSDLTNSQFFGSSDLRELAKLCNDLAEALDAGLGPNGCA